MATRIKWNLSAFEELRREPGIRRELAERAERIADAAGSGYVAEGPEHGRTRDRAAVVTETGDAIADNARHQTLLHSLDSGR